MRNTRAMESEASAEAEQSANAAEFAVHEIIAPLLDPEMSDTNQKLMFDSNCCTAAVCWSSPPPPAPPPPPPPPSPAAAALSQGTGFLDCCLPLLTRWYNCRCEPRVERDTQKHMEMLFKSGIQSHESCFGC